MGLPDTAMHTLSRIPWLLILLLLVATAWSIRPVSDPDVLWHLRAGQWMLAHSGVIRHDVFSAMRHGCDWVSIPWLYEVMIARLQAAWGWGALNLWQALMVVAIALQTALLTWLLRRRPEPADSPAAASAVRWDWCWPFLSVPAALAVLLTLRLLQMRINCRPELFTYLFLGSFLVVLSAAGAGQRAPGARNRSLLLWLLPLLQLFWTNLHGAFFIGPALVWVYAGSAWLVWLGARWVVARERPVDPDGLAPETEGDWPRHTAGPAPVRLTAVAILTTLACLATPYGLAGTLYPLHLFHVLTDPLYKTGIVEAHPVNFFTALDSGSLGYSFLAAWVLAGLGLLGRVLEAVRAQHSALRTPHSVFFIPCSDLGYFICCAAMAYLSLTAVRNVPLLALAAAPLMASGIEYAADGLAAVVAQAAFRLRRGRAASPMAADQAAARRGLRALPEMPGVHGVTVLHSRSMRIAGQVLLALGLVLFYRAIVSERFYDALGWRMRFAIGFSDHEHPLAAGDFIQRHRAEIDSRTLYGDTRSADYFLARFGPEWPVYFDSRHAEIYDPPSFRTAARTRTEPATFVREAATYGIGLVGFSLTDLKEDRSPLAIALGQTNTWQLVYLDDCAALFAANTPAQAAFVARYGLPCAPTNAALQRALFADWLKRQGHAGLAALNDPANQSLEDGPLARNAMRMMQLCGLWEPVRELEPLRFCRLASFLDHLGWNVVADDCYEEALRWPGSLRLTLPRAIRHAQAMRDAVADPALQEEMRGRIRHRAQELRRVAPEHPLAGRDGTPLPSAR